MSETNKETNFRRDRDKRNAQIAERYKQMMSEGYMQTRALEELADEFGFYTAQGVRAVLKRMGAIEVKQQKKIKPERIDNGK